MNALKTRLSHRAILEGNFAVVEHAASRQARFDAVKGHALDCITAVSGEAVAKKVANAGLQHLHRWVPLDDIPKITERYYTTAECERATWLLWDQVVHEELDVDGDYYMLREVFLRILPPFAAYKDKPGFHRSRRDVDALKYRFISHGPHRDSWAGDAENLINLWMALEPIPAEAGMFIVPGQLHKNLPHMTTRPYYATRDVHIPVKPQLFPLQPGDCIVFADDELHGTRLNTTAVTRVALSARFAVDRPRYRPEALKTNQDQWILSSDLHADQPEFLAVHEQAQTAPRDSSECSSAVKVPTLLKVSSIQDWFAVCPAASVVEGQPQSFQVGHYEFALARVGDRLYAFDNICPHLYYRLANSPQERERIHCAGHCLVFNIAEGTCAEAPSFQLHTHTVKVEDQTVWVKLNA